MPVHLDFAHPERLQVREVRAVAALHTGTLWPDLPSGLPASAPETVVPRYLERGEPGFHFLRVPAQGNAGQLMGQELGRGCGTVTVEIPGGMG